MLPELFMLLALTEGPLEALNSPEVDARGAAIEALSSALDHPQPADEIAAALARLALGEDELELRRASLRALGRRGDEACLDSLTQLVSALSGAERGVAARALAETPKGRARAWELLASGLREGTGVELPLDDLMRVGSSSLAERGPGAWTSAALSPFARLLQSPDSSTSQATLFAVDSLLDVLLQSGGDGALSFLEALSEAGYRADLVAEHRAEVSLLLGKAEVALAAARPLSEGAFLKEDVASQARGQGYLATAHFLQGEYERARAAFLTQRDLADALSRRSWSGRTELALRGVAAQLAAKAETSAALCWLADGGRATDLEVLGAAQRAHALALRAHLLSAQSDQLTFSSLDFLFGEHPAPWRVLESASAAARLDPRDALRWRLELLAAFATVAPLELPGVTPLGVEAQQTVRDEARLGLIREVLSVRTERLRQRLARSEQRLRQALMRGGADEELEEEIERLVREVGNARFQEGLDGEDLIYAARRPSSVALDLAATLREEGRGAEAQRLLESFLKEMEAGSLLQTYVWAIQSAARAESSIGSCLCDEGEPVEAERYFLRAVGRLEDLEAHFESRGLSPAAYRDITSMRAGVLISLAVNANVRLKDTERALEFFERAYELRQDAFATVLLACYRARSGKEREARAALARVVPEPGLYYNLACTHALLGDTQRALSFLELELSVNHTTRGARERQRAWARDDPDLSSLRSEARFEELTSPR